MTDADMSKEPDFGDLRLESNRIRGIEGLLAFRPKPIYDNSCNHNGHIRFGTPSL